MSNSIVRSDKIYDIILYNCYYDRKCRNDSLISIPNVIAMNQIGTEKVFIKYILHE